MRIDLSLDQAAYLRGLQAAKGMAEAKLEAALLAIMKSSNHRGAFAYELGDDPHIELLPARTDRAEAVEGRSAKPPSAPATEGEP